MVRRILYVVVAALVVALTAPSVVAQSSVCAGLSRPAQAFAVESKTVSSTAVTLTSATYKPTAGDARTWAKYAVLSVETDQIRYWPDGTAPTAAAGHLVEAGTYIVVCGGAVALDNLNMIRVTADATVRASYYR